MENQSKKFLDKYLFRPDLNLSGKWWHRLLSVVFIIALILLVGISILRMFDNTELPKYSSVGKLSDRIDKQARLIGDLVQPGEKIAVYEHNLYGTYNGKSYYSGNGEWLLGQEYYCSKDISNKIEEITEKTRANYYKGNLNLISLNEFKNYLSQNKANCVSVTSYNPLDNNEVRKKIVWGLEAENMAVWKVSITKTIYAVFNLIFFIIFVFIILLIFYYKVFIYIIYNKRNK